MPSKKNTNGVSFFVVAVSLFKTIPDPFLPLISGIKFDKMTNNSCG